MLSSWTSLNFCCFGKELKGLQHPMNTKYQNLKELPWMNLIDKIVTVSHLQSIFTPSTEGNFFTNKK